MRYTQAQIAEAKAKGNWPCGHPREGNQQSIGSAGVRCKICRQAITRKWYRKAKLNMTSGGIEG